MNRRGFFLSALGAITATCGLATTADALPVAAPETVGTGGPPADVEKTAIFVRRRRRVVIVRRRRRRF